jgi:hypothetical protein
MPTTIYSLHIVYVFLKEKNNIQLKKLCFRSLMAYFLSKVKNYALRGIDELLKKDLQKAEDFLNQHSSDYITAHVLSLLENTKDIDPIPRYYIIDAVLSNRFNISLKQAKEAWQKELDYAKKLHESIQVISKRDHIPRVYQCARFALNILKHLMQRGLTQTMVNYAYVAENFIVGLVATQECMCSSYTFYVQAIVNHFGYDDYVSDCIVPGHIYTLTNAKDIHSKSKVNKFFLLGFDAGFFENDMLMVQNWGSHAPFDWKQVKEMIDWDANFFFLVEKTELPECIETNYWGRNKKSQQSHVTGLLWTKSFVKKTYLKMIRAQIILLKIFEELSEYSNLQYAIIFAKYQIKTEILEYEMLTAFFDKENKMTLKMRISNYDKVVVKKSWLRVLQLNVNLNMANYDKADRELVCARELVVLFKDYINIWTTEQFIVLCDINQKCKKMIKEQTKFAERVGVKHDFHGFRLILEGYIYDGSNKGTHQLDLFQVQYISINQATEYFNDVHANPLVVYSHPSSIRKIPAVARSKLFIISMSSMDKSLFIVTFDYPDKDSKYVELVVQQQKYEHDLLIRMREIKNGTFSSKQNHIAKLKSRIEALSAEIEKLTIVKPQFIASITSPSITSPSTTIQTIHQANHNLDTPRKKSAKKQRIRKNVSYNLRPRKNLI